MPKGGECLLVEKLRPIGHPATSFFCAVMAREMPRQIGRNRPTIIAFGIGGITPLLAAVETLPPAAGEALKLILHTVAQDAMVERPIMATQILLETGSPMRLGHAAAT